MVSSSETMVDTGSYFRIHCSIISMLSFMLYIFVCADEFPPFFLRICVFPGYIRKIIV